MLRSRYRLRLIFPRTRRRSIQHLLQEATLLLKIIITKNHNVFISKEGENFNITIGKRIKICRKFRAMTGNQLGRAIGLNKSLRHKNYSIRNECPDSQTGNFKKIADVLNISLLSISPLFGDMPEEFMEILFWLDEEFWIAFSHRHTLPSRILIGIRTFSPA